MEIKVNKTEIKTNRVRTMSIITTINLLNPSREVSLAHTELQKAFSWQGKVLQFLGDENPYPESENCLSNKIEPTADVPEDNSFMEMFLENTPMTQTAYVKKLRNVIQHLSNIIVTQWSFAVNQEASSRGSQYTGDVNWPWVVEYLKQARLSLDMAKMWLGWELGSIRQRLEPQNMSERTYLPLQ
jgi:hypothetical protein